MSKMTNTAELKLNMLINDVYKGESMQNPEILLLPGEFKGKNNSASLFSGSRN